LRSLFESLENRLLFSTPTTSMDGGATFGTAAPLGKLAGQLNVNNSLSTGESSDFFSFSVRSTGNVNLTLGGMSSNANLRLFDANGKLLGNAARAGTHSETISQSLKKGTYVLSVDRADGAADTAYTVYLQADLNYENVSVNGTDYTLGLKRTDGTAAGIASGKETWVVIHGWLASPADVHDLAKAINTANPKLQVLELDWSEVASDSNGVNVVFNVPDVAAWAAAKLTSWGIAGTNLNLVGHSFGGYMTDQIAKDVSGGVNRVVALDPATAALGGTDFSGTDFAAHSQYSIAFIGSNYGTLAAAQTADETISLDVGRASSFAAHSAVRDLFTAMTEQNNTSHHDNISPLFSLKQISGPSAYRPFLADAMGNGYEALMVGKQSGGDWVPATLKYQNYATNRNITITA